MYSIMNTTNNVEIIRLKIEQCRAEQLACSKKTMTVPEMRKLLGLGKTESYWLVHREFFKTEVIAGQMRIDLESFEKWYANQTKHQKVTGERPGEELRKSSYSFQEAANLLGIHNADLYTIWKEEGLETIIVDFVKRIPVYVFENWYENQNKYRKIENLPDIIELEENYIPLYKAASLLGITKEQLSVLIRTNPFKKIFETQIFENRRWISNKSFQQFLNMQEKYQVVTEAEEQQWKNNQVESSKKFLSRTEAAALAGVSAGTITKWIQQEKISCAVIGKVIRINRMELLKWLERYRKEDK